MPETMWMTSVFHIHVQCGEVFLRVGRSAMHLERDPTLRSAHLDRLALHPIRHSSLLQRWELLLDGSPYLRLLAVSAVGRNHRERHTGVAEIGDRIGSLPWKRERGVLHPLACFRS